MKKFLILTLLAFAPLVHGAGIPITEPSSDAIIFGVASSSDSKEIEFNTGDGGSNVKLTVDDSRNVTLNTNELTLGDGAATDKKIIFNIGGSNPEIRWNNADSRIQFSNDGVTFKNVGSGAGGGGGVNMLAEDNADFESALAGTWTASGGALSAETSNPLLGAQAANFDASATSQTLSSLSKSLTGDELRGLRGKECEASFWSYYPNGSGGDYKIQVYDGTNVLVEADIPLSQVDVRDTPRVIFTCPTTGNLILRVISTADGQALIVDNAFMGEATISRGSSAQHYGTLVYPTTASCLFDITQTTFAADYPAVASCPVATVTGKVTAPSTKIPAGVVNGPGTFTFTFDTSHVGSGAVVNAACRLLDESDTVLAAAESRGFSIISSASRAVSTKGTISYQDSTAHEIRMQCLSASGNHFVDQSGGNRQFSITVERFPLSSESSLFFDQADWHIDANIGGANASLGTSAQTAYIEITDAGLDLVTNSGSAPVQIACASGTGSTGATCSSDESIGAAFVIPVAGKYEACFQFGHDSRVNGAGRAQVIFQLVETTNTSSAIIQDGKGRIQSQGKDADDQITNPLYLCGTFVFNSVGQKTIRLEYEQNVLATISNNTVLGDRSATLGDRDIHIAVRLLTQFKAGIRFDNMVSSAASGGSKQFAAYITAMDTVSRQIGSSAVVSAANPGVGESDVTIQTGFCATVPICTVNYSNAASVASSSQCTAAKQDEWTSTLVTIGCSDGTSVDDTDYMLRCECE